MTQTVPDDPTAEVTDLLQRLIRLRCVNDGGVDSGHETRAVELLRDHLGVAGFDQQAYEPAPGRGSLVARIEGSDPAAPSLLLMGHTDVVPVSASGWSREPFGGELHEGWIWGRGAIDMLNLTASMAVAFRRLAASGFRPRGTLGFLAVADEEAGGALGSGWLTEHAQDAVHTNYVLTEHGGVPVHTQAGTRLHVNVGQKGVAWHRLVVRGTPGHGSRPYGTDNAVVTAAQIVTRLVETRGTPRITHAWERFVTGMGYAEPLRSRLLDPTAVGEALAELTPAEARFVHACTHMTVAPTVIHGGTKTNVIPDRVELEVDIRVLPGQTTKDVNDFFDEALGPLRDSVDITPIEIDPPSESPVETALWDSVSRVSGRLLPGSQCIPAYTTGGTDARYFRALGVPVYGFGLFSSAMSIAQFRAMFHGNNERVDQESLRLSTVLFEQVARDLLE